jgi:hypothetical protein
LRSGAVRARRFWYSADQRRGWAILAAGLGAAHRRSDQPVQRGLAAILAADVAGYSRMMGADEEGTLERLKAHRRQLTDPKIKKHRGRIVKLTGEGVLVEFPSVVDAVRCAVEIQRAMVDRDADIPTTSASPCASESMSATSSSTATTFTATASISPRAWRQLAEPGGWRVQRPTVCSWRRQASVISRGTGSSNPSPSSRQSVSRGISPSRIEKPAVAAGCAGPAGQHGQQRRAGLVNITPTAGNISVGH